MEEPKILQSFLPPEESLQGLAWVKGEIWVASAKAGRLFEQRRTAEGDYGTHRDISSPVQNPGVVGNGGELTGAFGEGTSLAKY